MQIEHDIFSGLGETTLSNKDNESLGSEGDALTNNVEPDLNATAEEDKRNDNIMSALNGISIIPLLGDFKSLTRTKYKNFFDHVYLSQHSAHWMGFDEFKSILRSSEDGHASSASSSTGTVEVETGKFIFQLKEKDQIALLDKITSLAQGNGFVRVDEGGSTNTEDMLHLNTISFKTK